jgi:conjugal transfer/entry exclusion protein
LKVAHIKKLNRFREVLSQMRDVLDDMAGEYRDKYDNASEAWQASEKGNDCDTTRESLEQAAADVESAESTVADIVSTAEG